MSALLRRLPVSHPAALSALHVCRLLRGVRREVYRVRPEQAGHGARSATHLRLSRLQGRLAAAQQRPVRRAVQQLPGESATV